MSAEAGHHTACEPYIAHYVVRAHDVLERSARRNIFDLAGGGFESTVRRPRARPTWVPIFMQNKYNVLDAGEHIHQLQIFRRMLERDDTEGLRTMIQRANRKKILK
ncbi:MAG: prephenate dehydrogenase dimerization domain-containing protein [Alistipes sp.]